MFSTRVPADLTPNRLTERVRGLRSSGMEFCDLTESNPTRVGLAYPADWPRPLDTPGAPPYDPCPFGLEPTRVAVAREYARQGVEVDVRRIVLTTSTSEAYSLLFKLLCDPGSSVLVPRPSYPLFEHLTRLDAVTAEPYWLRCEGDWRVDLASVREALARARDPRAILIVSPNNPTGSRITADDLAALAGLARAHELVLISDEVFADYSLAVERSTASGVLDQAEVLAFTLGGLSKTIGMPQVKLGWMAVGGPSGPVDQALARLELICDTYLTVSSLVQRAVPQLLDQGADVRDQIVTRLRENHAELARQVAHHPSTSLLRSEAGWSAVLRVPAVRGEEDLVMELLDCDRVLVHPGYFYDFATEAYLVVSLLPEPSRFAAGVAALLARAEV